MTMYQNLFGPVLRCLAIFTFTAAVSSALGDIIPVSQVRTVDATASAAVDGISDSDSDSDAAADFAPFGSNAQAVAGAVASVDLAFAEGSANQLSSIGSTVISAEGDGNVSLTLIAGPGASAEAQGSSVFDLVFLIDALSTYTLGGTVDTEAVVTGGGALPALANTVRLEDVDNAAVLFQTLTADEAFLINGTLLPGTYRLFASATSDASDDSAESGFITVAGLSTFSLNFAVNPDRTSVPDAGGGLAALALVSLCGFGCWNKRRLQ